MIGFENKSWDNEVATTASLIKATHTEHTSTYTFSAHAVGELPCSSQPPAPTCVVRSWRLKGCFPLASAVMGRVHRACSPLFRPTALLLSEPLILIFHVLLPFQESKRLTNSLTKGYTQSNIKPLYKEVLYLSYTGHVG